MRYHVKWKGYEKKADRTWETEENLEFVPSLRLTPIPIYLLPPH